MPDQDKQMPDGTAAKARGKPSLKVLLLVGAVMLIEGIAVFAFVSLTGRGPGDAKAAELAGEQEANRQQLVEIELISDRLQNLSTNRVWVWETEIYLKVRQKNSSSVQKTLEGNRAEIHAGIAGIFRKAQHSHLKEPGLETITRQLTAYVNEVFGVDADEMPKVERVLIPKCKGFPADY